MAKKLRRKDLKQPDEFVTFTMKVGQWIRDNQRLVMFIAGGVIFVVVAVALAIQLTGNAKVASSSTLWVALNKASTPVVSAEEREKLPEDVDYYDTREERAKASAEAYQAVVDEHGSSSAGAAAKLGLASAKLSLGDYAEARTLYEDFLSNNGGLGIYESVAVEGAGYSYEGQKNYDKALEMFRRLEKLDDGDHQDLARYHQGRILEKMNKRTEAADIYRNIVRRSEQATDEMITNGYAFERAEGRLAIIDPGADVLKNRNKGRDMADILRKMRQGGAPPPGLPPRPPPGAGPGGDR